MNARPSLALKVLAWVALAAIAGEVSARVEDLLQDGVPFLDTPTSAGLVTRAGDGVARGRPGARFQAVKMNALGLRGPELPPTPSAGCTRWLFLGASEVFGDARAADSDFPSAVRRRVAGEPCIEVANAALVGFDLPSTRARYEAHLVALGAQVVFIYPPTHFYLQDPPPHTAPPPVAIASDDVEAQSRFVMRLDESDILPRWLKSLRVRRGLWAKQRNQPTGYIYASLPAPALDRLDADLRALVGAVRAHGATPVLITHAIRATSPPRDADRSDLLAMRGFLPRSTDEVLCTFEEAAAARTRAVAQALDVDLVDAAAAFSGRREMFTDLVHLSVEGTDAMAELIVQGQRARGGHALQ